MSAELLAIIFSAAGLLVTLGGGLFAGFAWMIRRTDAQLTEVKISLARLEGPRELLILPRGSVNH